MCLFRWSCSVKWAETCTTQHNTTKTHVNPPSLLREYFEVEFGLVAQLPWSPDGAVDLERIVDDFVLFCMLVGNDFLPGECCLII